MRTALLRAFREVGWLFLVALLLVSGPQPASAQTDLDPAQIDEEATPFLIVTSEPSGAVVTLSGPYEWVGRTPWTVLRPVSGLYQVRAHLPGYSPWSSEVYLGPGAVENLNIRLSRKTRFQAGLRSLIFPGWGQAYYGSGRKGTLLSLSEAGALIGMIWTWENYQDDVDRFDDAAESYRNSTDLGELPALRRALADADREADQSHDHHKLAGYIAGGVYLFSFLDALFFFPSTPQVGGVPTEGADLAPLAPEPPVTLGWAASAMPGGSTRLGLSLSW